MLDNLLYSQKYIKWHTYEAQPEAETIDALFEIIAHYIKSVSLLNLTHIKNLISVRVLDYS